MKMIEIVPYLYCHYLFHSVFLQMSDYGSLLKRKMNFRIRYGI